MKHAELVNGKNYFNQKSFTEICKKLEQGERVEVYIDCIGHTRNNYEQEQYKKALEKQFGELLEVERKAGYCSYSYAYQLIIK